MTEFKISISQNGDGTIVGSVAGEDNLIIGVGKNMEEFEDYLKKQISLSKGLKPEEIVFDYDPK